MHTKLEHLTSCLGEECGEIQQMIGKISRFGILEVYPKVGKTNWLRLRDEVHDLVAVWQMFCDEFDRNDEFDPSKLAKKKKRVEKYMAYAREIGELEPQQKYKGLPPKEPSNDK